MLAIVGLLPASAGRRSATVRLAGVEPAAPASSRSRGAGAQTAPAYPAVGLRDLQRAVDRRRCGIAVEEGQHLQRGVGGNRRGEHDVARRAVRCARAAPVELGGDARPGRVAVAAVQVVAALAGRPARQHERPDDAGGLADPGDQVRDAVAQQPVRRAPGRCRGRPRARRGRGAGGRAAAAARTDGATRRAARTAASWRRAPTSCGEAAAGATSASWRDAGVLDHDRAHSGRREQRRDRGTHPAGAGDLDHCAPTPREDRDAALAAGAQRGRGQVGRRGGPARPGSARPATRGRPPRPRARRPG